MVREARQQRRLVDGVLMDWVVVRDRLSMLDSRNMQRIIAGLNDLAMRLGFRSTDASA
jgi:chromosome partitioning protein